MPDRQYLIQWLDGQTKSPVQGYYFDGFDGLDETYTLACWCENCGGAVAERRAALRCDGEKPAQLAECWSGDDSLQWCGGDTGEGCNEPLYTGGLTTYGIDDCIDSGGPDDLRAASEAMTKDDPRWEGWERQVLNLIQDEGEETRWMDMDAPEPCHA